MAGDQNVSKAFVKDALLTVVEELEIVGITESTRKADIIQAIRDDVEENGLLEEMSEDLWDIMVLMGFMDKDGNELDGDAITEDDPEDEDLEQEDDQDQDLPEELPQCFGWGDASNSPACGRCKLSTACMERTLSVTIPGMVCWGEYEADDTECQGCVLWRQCKDSATG